MEDKRNLLCSQSSTGAKIVGPGYPPEDNLIDGKMLVSLELMFTKK